LFERTLRQVSSFQHFTNAPFWRLITAEINPESNYMATTNEKSTYSFP